MCNEPVASVIFATRGQWMTRPPIMHLAVSFLTFLLMTVLTYADGAEQHTQVHRAALQLEMGRR